jgi:2',3'-cyclic-nucleotide 2'-phosphodiesterase (5'-nucleotidase family)
MLAAMAVLVMSVTAGACAAAGGGADAGAHVNDGPPRVTLEGEVAKEVLGEDDGFQGVIFYGAELQGSIDDCGCPGHPQGGLPWRLGYTEGFRSAYPEVAYLQVDAGNSMADLIDNTGKLLSDQNVKCEWVVKAFDKFGFDAMNISHKDIYYLAKFLKAGEWEKAVAAQPGLARFVSANLEPEKADSGLVAPPPYVVRTMTGSRLPGGSIRVAFIGLTENNPNLPQHTGFKVVSPEIALERVLPKARAESDVVVVLLYGGAEIAQSLSKRTVGQVSTFIISHPTSRDKEAQLGPVNLVYARFQTKNLGELRMKFDGKSLASVTNRYVLMDAKLPKDPLAEAMAAEAKEAIKQAQIERFNNTNPPAGNPAPPPADQPASGGK